MCPILTKLNTHVCDHNILIKFDIHGNRFSHLGVMVLYLQKTTNNRKWGHPCPMDTFLVKEALISESSGKTINSHISICQLT